MLRGGPATLLAALVCGWEFFVVPIQDVLGLGLVLDEDVTLLGEDRAANLAVKWVLVETAHTLLPVVDDLLHPMPANTLGGWVVGRLGRRPRRGRWSR